MQLSLPEEVRHRYFELALRRALARKEITQQAGVIGVAPADLRPAVVSRAADAWATVPEEETHLAEVLAAREAEGTAQKLKSAVTKRSSPRPVDDRVKRMESVLLKGLTEKGVLPLLREELNKRLAPSGDLVLRVVDAPGLAEMVEATTEIRTGAFQAVERLIEQMPGGSIGIAGPRGAGKTTLIRAFCKTRELRNAPTRSIEIAAPVDYDAREFVLHLFERLAQEVRGTVDERLRSLRWMRGRALVGILVAEAGAFVLAAAAIGWKPHLDALWFVGAGLVFVGLAWAASSMHSPAWSRDASARLIHDPDGVGDGLRVEADKLLREIKFQQSFTQGWSGSLKLPAGVELGADSSTTWAERQRSFPEIVDQIRGFIREVTASHLVVIGIDEMDKITSNESAQRFLNDIKGIFGIPRCYYLVSISEDAMSNFERRGLPFRDAFDSSFDEVVHVTFFSLDDTTRFLEGRVVGLSVPFAYLCHCVSGGLARDVIRVARDIVGFAERPEDDRRVDVVCRSLVCDELEGKCDALTLAARTLSVEPALSDFVRWAKTLRAVPIEPNALLEHIGRYPDSARRLPPADTETPERREQARLTTLATELVGFVYFAATLLEFFAPPLPQSKLEAGHHSADERRRLDALAEARQTFAINAGVAWERVSAFRAAWGCRTIEFPARPAGRAARTNGRRAAARKTPAAATP